MAGITSIPAIAVCLNKPQSCPNSVFKSRFWRLNSKNHCSPFKAEYALETQRSDLELQIRRDDTQTVYLEQQIEEMESLLSPEQQQTELADKLTFTVAQLKDSILSSLPYRTTERLNSITEIEQQLISGELSSSQATIRVWNLLEDEKRLNRENSLDKATIQFGGESVLAECRSDQFVALYCMTSDGRLGFVERQGSDWTWVEVTDPSQQEGLRIPLPTCKRECVQGRISAQYFYPRWVE